jgi:hypothetical protein
MMNGLIIKTNFLLFLFIGQTLAGPTAGARVFLQSGALHLVHVDNILSPAYDFAIIRSYDSKTNAYGFTGTRWISSLENRIRLSPDNQSMTVQIKGEQWMLKLSSKNTYKSGANPFLIATQKESGVDVKVGDRELYRFNGLGSLVSWSNLQNQELRFAYRDNTYPIRISDKLGNSWTIKWNKNEQVSEILGPERSHIKYEYNQGRLEKVLVNGQTVYQYGYDWKCFYCLTSSQSRGEKIESISYQNKQTGDIASVTSPGYAKLQLQPAKTMSTKEKDILEQEWTMVSLRSPLRLPAQQKTAVTPPNQIATTETAPSSQPLRVVARASYKPLDKTSSRLQMLEFKYREKTEKFLFNDLANQPIRHTLQNKITYDAQFNKEGYLSKVSKNNMTYQLEYLPGNKIQTISGVDKKNRLITLSKITYMKNGNIKTVLDGNKLASVSYTPQGWIQEVQLRKLMSDPKEKKSRRKLIAKISFQYTDGGTLKSIQTKSFGNYQMGVQGKLDTKKIRTINHVRSVMAFLNAPLDRIKPPDPHSRS